MVFITLRRAVLLIVKHIFRGAQCAGLSTVELFAARVDNRRLKATLLSQYYNTRVWQRDVT